MNRTLFAIIIGFALGGSIRPATAGCGHLFVKHHAVVAPVVQPIVLYGVGSDLAIEAAVERAFQRRELNVGKSHINQPGTLSQTASVIQAKCVRCHSGNEPAGGIDFRFKIDDFAFRRTVEILGESINVPEKMQGVVKGLTAEEKGSITSEMMRLPARKPEQAEAPGVLR